MIGVEILEVDEVTSRRRGQGLVPATDGLPALEVAEHAREKEFVLQRIVDIFNVGMQKRWSQRYYVDVFAGPGKCVIRGTTAEINGSPTLAATAKAKFTDYFLADSDPDCLSTLKERISRLALPEEIRVRYYGNHADRVVDEILADLPPARQSLGLAVFDPWGWDFSFQTLAAMSENRRLDLVVNFPIGFIKRNWDRELAQLDKFMNGISYKDPFQAAMRRTTPGELPARVLLDAYAAELRNIGYQYIRDNVLVDNSRHLTLYCLIFASKHERGTDFWDKVTQRQESGQFRMPI